jgi:hypothetical protein
MALKRPTWPAGRVVTLEHTSKVLADNPLGDSHVRTLDVWLPPVSRKLIERTRPFWAVSDDETGIAGVRRRRTPVTRVFHSVNQRAVTARRFAEHAAVLAGSPRAELAVDEGHELAGQIVGVAADGARVHVLVAAERRKAIRKNNDDRPHLALMHEPRGALGHVLVEVAPHGMRTAAVREADEVEQHREARTAAAAFLLVVLRGEPDVERTDVAVAERVIDKHPRRVLERHDAPRWPRRALQRHGVRRALAVRDD